MIDAAGTVLNIDQMAALDEKTPYPSAAPARYAIELNRGAAAKAGVKPGYRITLGEIPRRK